MITSFLQYYDRITNFSAPGYEEGEILLFLNNAQDQLIKIRAFGENFQPPALEDNAKRVADLRLLTKSASLVPSDQGGGLYRASVPADMAYHVSAKLSMTRTYPTMTLQFVECKFIKTDHADRFVQSDANKTHHLNPVVYINETYFYIQCDSHVSAVGAAGFNLAYIEIPAAIVASDVENPNFPAHAHQEVVDIAVRQALQVQMDPRWQGQVAEQQIKSE